MQTMLLRVVSSGEMISVKDELVFATLRFQTREYNGQVFMDIVATEVIKR